MPVHNIILIGNWIISGILLAWGVIIKLDGYSKMEAARLYRKWKSNH